MDTLIWWIGAVHLLLYALFGTAALAWAIVAKALRDAGNVHAVVLWLVDRHRRREGKEPLER